MSEILKSWRRVILLGLLTVFSNVASSQMAKPGFGTVEVRDLVDSGAKYTNRLVVVHGCYVHEFEISVLQPCDSRFNQFSKYSIWLADINQVTNEAEQTNKKGFIPARSSEVLMSGRDDLWQLSSSRDHPVSIVVEGEFQTSWWRKYGHLDGYKHRFIVHLFLEHSEPEKALSHAEGSDSR